MQEVGRKPLLRFLHSPHPCGLATQERLPGWGEENKNKAKKLYLIPLILTFSLREKGLSVLNLMAVTQSVGTRTQMLPA